MSFDYEQSIWGRNTATLKWSDPASFRLHQALQVVDRAFSENKEPHVLEVGCGAGQFIRGLKKLRPSARCHGSDISREAISAAETFNDGVEYALSEEVRLPYRDASMDVVLIFDVLEHVQNPEQFLKEVQRVLRPAGLLYSFVPCEGDRMSLWYWLDVFKLKNSLTQKYAGHIHYFSRAELLKLFERAGLRNVYTRYSEHLVGQLAGVVSFYLMHRSATRSGVQQLNNESFFNSSPQKSALVRAGKWAANMSIFIESSILRRVPSPNVHCVAVKP